MKMNARSIHALRSAALGLALTLSLVASAGSAQSFPGAPGNFDRVEEQLRAADKNGDGSVSRSEYRQQRAAQWSSLDRDGDGFFSKDDLPSFLQSRWDGERIADLRRQFDRNGDGRISRTEFVDGPMPGFDLADANHDQLVTEAEMKVAAQKFKAK
jgi:Ca2+-binding EF-hand superfamily protein